MHLTIERELLLKHLEHAARISTRHQTLPVLQCVLLDASGADDALTLRATNLELGLEARVSARVKARGTLAAPATVLAQTIALVREREVVLKTDGELLVVESGKSRTAIKTLGHEEFPLIQRLEGTAQRLGAALFALGVKTAAFASSQSSVKPELGSVFIHQKQAQSLTFVATDSFRLVEKTVPTEGVALAHPLLVPQKNALELARLCEALGEDPEMLVSENQFALRFPSGVYITTRLTEASFPDYQQIIPKEFATEATALRGDLAHALRKTNIFAGAFLQVRMDIKPKAQSITLTAEGGEVGTTEEVIPATIEGDELTLSFNQRYLNDPLASFVDDGVVMCFAGAGRPMVMEGVSEKSRRYLVMPRNR